MKDCNMKMSLRFVLAVFIFTCLFGGFSPLSASKFDPLDKCNIVWDSPSKGMGGSMPLGNGDIGTNVWMEENGDLVFYISKNDSWGDNGRLLKVGRVRVSLSPSPVIGNTSFHQELDLKNGQMLIDIDGDNPTSLKFWVDANNPVINIETKSKKPIKATAKVELWRTEQKTRPVQVGSPYHKDPQGRQHVVEPDSVIENYEGGVAWYHRNIKSIGPEMTMKFQGLDEYPGFEDTLLHRTFGAVIKGKNATRIDDMTLESSGKDNQFSVYVVTEHPSTEKDWLGSINKIIAKTEKKSLSSRYRAHCKWWNKFWGRSWIYASSTKQTVTALIPSNEHTFKVGVDQHGGNKFAGEMGRVSVINRALSKEEVGKRASQRSEFIGVKKADVLYIAIPALHSAIADSSKWTDSGEITIEAWVNPEQLPGSGARIVDKLTPGGSDGILLDTWPGNSLRLIVADKIVSVRDCLQAGKWSHVAVVVSSKQGRMELFLNGKLVAEEKMAELMGEAFTVTRGYNLQRFIDACGSRGQFPVKFNGAMFTVDFNGDPDDRRWGQGYWWQNTRLPYISMAASGDYDLLKPLFRMYGDDIFPLCEYRTKKYFGYEGAYFGECMYPWGAIFSNTYGWDKPFSERKDPIQRSMWHKWEWVAGPELVFMMMDYCDYTGDEKYRKEKVVPIAEAIMSFFENYYKTGADGKLVMHPSQAVETWIECTNPMPEIAGLRGITKRLLLMDEKLSTKAQRAYWKAFMEKIPAIPTRDTADGKALAPAEKFARKINVENPELYAVFPFRQIGVGNDNIEWGVNALKHRWDRGAFGWRQDDIFMAYLGLTDQAREYLVKRARNYDKNSRFPAFWGPNYDWVPDQDHGGVLMKATQAMLIQADPYSKKIYLMPAWPKDWDVDFKLHAPYKTIIKGTFKNGKITKLHVTPRSRKKDIVMP